MGLSQSLYTGYSGLVTHQRAMDNTSNNLANVNTVGYRTSDFMFANLLKKNITGAFPAMDGKGSTNPKNLGLGVTTGAILHNFRPGNMEMTDNPLNCAIDETSGKSFFLVGTSTGAALTRNGDFTLDNHEASGRRMLVLNSMPVQGWMAANDVITPSPAIGNIFLPSPGDMLAGRATETVTLSGVLPTDASAGNDFDGRATDQLALEGNLAANGQSFAASIYAPVTRTAADGGQISDGFAEVPVRIDFAGPTLSADGTTNQWTWTMSTRDYPNPGDSVQIYPAEGDPDFTQGALNFHATASPTQGFGIGQAVANTISPGSSQVAFTDGEGVTTSFGIDSGFTLDVSRLTNLAGADGDIETWSVNGNPAGTMSRSIFVWDEFTDFVPGANGVVTPETRVGLRESTIIFERGEQTNAGTAWNWTSTSLGASGELNFDTRGDLVSSSQTGGDIDFEWDGIVYTATDGRISLDSQDGYADGFLNADGLSIDDNGIIWGTYSNQQSVRLAQLALGTVGNLSGLSGSSGTLFYANSASGALQIGVANDSAPGMPALGLGSVFSNALESSNVQIGREFTTMISIQRGFQFNSRIVTTADEMLQTAVSLKT